MAESVQMPKQGNINKNDFELSFRDGSAADYEPALAIQRRAYGLKEVPLYGPDIPPLSETPETLARELAGGRRLLVAVHAGRLVGSLRMERLGDGGAYFCRLSVDPDLQGRGIGQRLVEAFERHNADAGAYVLDCGVASAENRHIYTKMGYRETGEEFQVPNGPRCLVMRKSNVEFSRKSGTLPPDSLENC